MGDVYPEIVDNRELIRRVILSEEERFGATLRQGQVYLAEAFEKLEGDTLSGEQAFTLHDTYGFPVEVTEEMCADRGVKVDMEGFERCMEAQRERARAANVKDAEAAWSTYGGVHADILKEVGATEFVGYDRMSASSGVRALIKEGQRVDSIAAGDTAEIVLGLTPFYAEMGGEVGDTGVIEGEGFKAEVVDTEGPRKGPYLPQRESRRRRASCGRHRSCSCRRASPQAHFAQPYLHAFAPCSAASGSGRPCEAGWQLRRPDRLRFDFTHFEGVTPEQLAEVERVANEQIMNAVPMSTYEASLDAARESGVTALFGEKYGDTVRVVEAGEFSRELCGGCHVANTAEIGFVKIVSESSVGANLRRIEAVTSFDALAYMNKVEEELKETAAELRVPLFDVSERTAANIATIKDFEAKRKANKKMAAEGSIAEHLANMVNVGYPLIVARIDGLDAGGLRNAWDILRGRMPEPGACVIGTINNGKPVLMAAATDEAVAAGFNAGNVIKAIAGNIKGGGGGKPTMAQAGGKDAAGIDAALDAARELLAK